MRREEEREIKRVEKMVHFIRDHYEREERKRLFTKANDKLR